MILNACAIEIYDIRMRPDPRKNRELNKKSLILYAFLGDSALEFLDCARASLPDTLIY